MQWLQFAIFGLVVGAIAKFLIPGRQGGGIIITAILGMIGSVGATFLAQSFGLYKPGETAGWIASIVGTIVVVLLYGMIFRGKASS